jgi:Cu/Ag efflux protein CusF
MRLRQLMYVVSLVGSLACSKSPADSGLPPPDQVYTVRGVVESLPAGSSDEMTLRHEAISSFINASGRKVGMKTMAMSFTKASGASLDGIAVGDKVKFTFEVRHQSSPMLRVTRLEELPPDTALELE